ncbi:MAG TPA: CDP-archaeol synthase [Desulfatiglandales bacterium]|nr:CDP-archaeol synthase [Desulfatiglandales bacterium]
MGCVLEIICQILFLGSPLLLVAMAQGFCIKYDWLSRLKRPLDLGLSFKENRIFGDHKTWRGFVINLTFCTLGTMIQASLQNRDYLPSWLPLLDYKEYRYLSGIFLGIGMTLGELLNSFLKRQLKIAPGKRRRGILGVAFFLFDQVDLTIGMWVFFFFLIKPSLLLILWSFLITIVLHVTISIMGYLLGIRKTIL